MRFTRKELLLLSSAIILVAFSFVVFRFGQFSFARHWFGDTTMGGRAWIQNIGDIWFNCFDYAARFGGTCADKHDAAELTGDEVIAFNADVHSQTDIFSGWAWSNIGWITFDKDQTGDPYAGYTNPYLAIATSSDTTYPLGSPLSPGTELRGWAQARSGAIDPLPDEPPPDWTGWITLNCKDFEEMPGETRSCLDTADPAFNSANNLVDFKVAWNKDTRELHGWAWGGDLVGWISFNCEDYLALPEYAGYSCVNKAANDPTLDPASEFADYAVVAKINQPPKVKNMQVAGEYADGNNDCYAPPRQRFTWEFSDADDGSTQTAYELQISPFSDFSVIAASQAFLATNATVRNLDVTYPVGANELAYNVTYYWRVKVYDSGQVLDSAGDGSKNSDWWYPSSTDPDGATLTGPGDSFATAEHLYPTAAFTFTPKKPSQREEVRFMEQATCYESRDTNNDGIPEPNATGTCPNPAQGPQAAVACPLPSGNPEDCYAWDFDYPAPPFTPDAFGRVVRNTYDDTAAHTVGFRITDKEGYTCITESAQEQIITPQLPLPKFRETAPSGLDKARDYTASAIDKSALDFKKIIFK